jgi:GT2 family glycosyltransferase
VTPSVSIVIPSYDKASYLELTLASFSRQSEAGFEIVLVDDGSRDQTGAVAARWSARLPLHYVRQENRGRAAARNLGLRHARGELVLFCDDDRIAAPGFVAAHLRGHQRPDRMVLGEQRAIRSHAKGTRTLSCDDVLERFDAMVARSFDDPWWSNAGRPLYQERGLELDGFRAPWLLGTTANLSIGLVHLDAVGGFDEHFVGWGLEDVELCYRLHQTGLATVISTEALSFHQVHPSGPERLLDWQQNLQRFVEKHPTREVAFYARFFAQPGRTDLLEFDRQLAGLSS